MTSEYTPPSDITFTCSTISCTPTDFDDLFRDESISTDLLSKDALLTIARTKDRLRADYQQYRLDDFLIPMLESAPHPVGKRYVAVAIHLAQQKGEQPVLDLANAWMDQLFLPMWTISSAYMSELYYDLEPAFPHGSAITDIDALCELQSEESHNKIKISIREHYHCSIDHTFDVDRAHYLISQGRTTEVPHVQQRYMQTAPIIPFLPTSSNGIICGVKIRDIRHTWNLLQSYAGFDVSAAVGSAWNIFTPTNTIYMSYDQHIHFRKFWYSLDKNAYPDTPNKYKLHLGSFLLGVGQVSRDIEFPTCAESCVEPPSASLLGVHAAFAKVLEACGAAAYVSSLEEDAVDYQGMLDYTQMRGEEQPEEGSDVDTTTPVIL